MSSVLREILARFDIAVDDGELAAADKKVDGFATKLADVGKSVLKWFAAGALIKFGGALLQDADALAKAAQSLGLAGQELQELEHAANLSGIATEELRAALARLQKGAAEAAEKGTGPVAEAYKKLGVSVKNQDGTLRSSADIFQDVADGISTIENPTEKAGVAAALFGKSYAKLIPLLDEGGAGIQKLRDEVRELGFGFDEAFLEKAQEVNDNVDRMKGALKGLAVQALAIVLPKLAKLTELGVKYAREAVRWIRQSNILKAVMVALSAKGLIMLSRFIGPLGTRLIFLSRVFKAFALRILLPILLIDDLITTFEGGESVTRDLIDALFGVGATEKVVHAMKDVWRDFAENVLPMVGPVLQDVKGWFTSAAQWGMDQLAALRDFAHSVWEALPGPLQDVLDAIANMFSAVFDWIGNKISEMIDKFNPLKGLLDDLVSTSDAAANRAARQKRKDNDAVNLRAEDLAKQGASKDPRKAKKAADELRAFALAHPGEDAAKRYQEFAKIAGTGLQKFNQPAQAAVTRAPTQGAAPTTMNSNTVNHITVPAGTPADMAKDVAKAAGKATADSNRRTLEGIPGAG